MPESISVIIPAYNAAKYLPAALKSVIQQTLPPHEIIIVDDGSTDTTPAIAESAGSRVLYFRQLNQGAGPARNAGVQLANGSLIAFLDADDLWEPDKLAKQFLVLSDHPELSAVFSYVQQFISPEINEAIRCKLFCPIEPMVGIHPGTMLIKKDIFEKIGPFSAAYSSGEFLEWFCRAKEQGLLYRILPDALMHRRIHDTNSVLTNEKNTTEYMNIIKAALDRRRAAQKEPYNGQ